MQHIYNNLFAIKNALLRTISAKGLIEMKKMISALLTVVLTGKIAFAQAPYSYLSDYDNKKITYGVGNDTDSMNRPLGAISAQKQYGDMNSLFIGEAENKRLWLTFDEGYENGYTEKILDTLASKGAKATFFITQDYAEKNPGLIKRMIADGHTVGNHSYSHPSLPECSNEDLYNEIMQLHNYISKNFGYEMYVMRPPKGEFSERVLACAKELGYTTVLWSFAYQDWLTENQPEPTAAYDKITSKTHNGAVYLLHAVSKTNAEILPKVIDYWHENGYIITPM